MRIKMKGNDKAIEVELKVYGNNYEITKKV